MATMRRPPLLSALELGRIRRTEFQNRTFFALPDVLAMLTDEPEAFLARMLSPERPLGHLVHEIAFPLAGGQEHEMLPAADLPSIFRIVESIQHPRAENLKNWLAQTAARHIEESGDPELAVVRARQEYQAKGYPRQWIDQRLRSISARAEIVGEWHRRGASASDDYRSLTNCLTQDGFGMDVETYRQHKGLFGRENLRDHMTEMELALLTLGETVAAAMHRSRGSQRLMELEHDMQDAGRIVAETRRSIEKSVGRNVIEAARTPPSKRRNPGETPAGDAGRTVVYRRETETS